MLARDQYPGAAMMSFMREVGRSQLSDDLPSQHVRAHRFVWAIQSICKAAASALATLHCHPARYAEATRGPRSSRLARPTSPCESSGRYWRALPLLICLIPLALKGVPVAHHVHELPVCTTTQLSLQRRHRQLRVLAAIIASRARVWSIARAIAVTSCAPTDFVH